MKHWTPYKLSDESKDRLLAWALSDDTGVSSETIARIAIGIQPKSHFGFDIPHDGSDFGRCHRLLEAVPELRDALPLVAEVCPKWRPLVARWNEIEAAYLRDRSETPVFEEVSNGRGRRKTRRQVNQRACYDLLRALRDDCYRADGWVKDGELGWAKVNP